jgi:hypothetical protein
MFFVNEMSLRATVDKVLLLTSKKWAVMNTWPLLDSTQARVLAAGTMSGT